MRRFTVTLLVCTLLWVPTIAQKHRRLIAKVGTGGGGGGGGTLALASMSDFSCLGVWKGAAYTTGANSTGFPVAMDHGAGGGGVRIFTYNGDGHIYSHPEPASNTWSPCPTALSSLTGVSNGSLTDWGTVSVQAGENAVPGINSSFAFGLSADEALGGLLISYSATYTGLSTYVHNGVALALLNEGSHTLTLDGCWGLTGVRDNWIGSQVVLIPSTFLSANGITGRYWGLGTGIATGPAPGYAEGPTLFATTPPTDHNGCPATTDTLISTFSTLTQFVANGNGTSCRNNSNSGPGIGCDTSGMSETNPLPAKTAYTGYSADDYNESWDPHNSHGWFQSRGFWRMNWYRGGKEAIFVAFDAPSGWMNTTITGVPASGAITVADISAHDRGTTPNPGDIFWFQSCEVGVDPPSGPPNFDNGCDTANTRYVTTARVTAVNPGTKRIDYDVVATDPCSLCSDHNPVIGGAVYMGATYIQALPTRSRTYFGCQIIDPQKYIDVLNGAAVYSPTYTEDVGCVAQFGLNGIGDALLGAGGTSFSGGEGNKPTGIAAVLVDNAAKRLRLVYKYWDGTSMSQVVYVLSGP